MRLAYNLPSLSDNKNKHIEEIKSNSIWVNILNKINETEQDSQLNNLLNDAKFIEIKNNILVFAVKDKFTRETLIRNYFLIIKRQIAEIDDNIKMISITVDSSINNIPLDSNLLADSNAINSESEQKRNLENDIFSKTNPKFIFDNYVTGETNIVAYKITKDIALQNVSYNHNNVFYVHSNVGMGKTHLLQSIVNEVNSSNKSLVDGVNTYKCKVGYLSAEKFMHNFVSAVKNNTLFSLDRKSVV